MKIKKSKKTKTILPALILAVTLLIAGAFVLFSYLSHSSSNKALTNYEKASESTHKSDNEQAQNLNRDPSIKQESPNTDKPSTPASNGENKKQVQMVATADKSSDTVFIRGGVNYPVENGTCYALLQGPAGQSLRKNTTVLQNPSSADCKTISIPLNELSTGKWTFKLHYTSDTYEGASDEVSFVI